MANLEKVVVRTAGPLLVAGATFEIIGRVRGHGGLRQIAWWLSLAGLLAISIPLLAVVAYTVYERFSRRRRG